MNFNKKVTEYLDKAPEEQIPILQEIREMMHTSIMNVGEEIKWGFPVFNNGKDFAYLRSSKMHITLGFYNIDKLKDPNNLLEGQGNTLKHIKINRIDDNLKDQIIKWLNQITQ